MSIREIRLATTGMKIDDSVRATRRVRKAFDVNRQCGLCFYPLPGHQWSRFDPPVEEHEEWQLSLRAVLCLDIEANGENVEITEPFTLTESPEPIKVQIPGHSTTEQFYVYPRACESVPWRTAAFVIHDWCYTVLKWKLRPSYTCRASDIYKLARTLQPGMSKYEWDPMYGKCPHTISPACLETLLLDKMSLSDNTVTGQRGKDLQPFFLPLLPAELKSSIWRYAQGPSPYSSFLIVACEATRLLCSLEDPSPQTLSLRQGSFLIAKEILVLGTTMIRALISQEESLGSEEYKIIKIQGPILGYNLIANTNGICALQLFGDEWEAEWLGHIPSSGNCWHGTVKSEIAAFTSSYSSLCAINLMPMPAPDTRQIMWDRPDYLHHVADQAVCLFGSKFRPVGLHPCELCFMRCVPLERGDEYMSGLTVYHTGNTTTGLEAHFHEDSEMSGSRKGVALFFQLRPGEKICQIWLQTRVRHAGRAMSPALEEPAHGPALLIQTTLGRSHYFGSCIRPDDVVRDQFRWISLNDSDQYLTSIIHENAPEIKQVGVLAASTPIKSMQAAPLQFPIATQNWTPPARLFLSTTTVLDFNKIEVCHVGKKCTGMLLHATHNISTLGQFHPSHLPNTNHTMIYEKTRSTLSTIGFEYVESWGRKIVVNVHVSTAEVPQAAKMETVFGLGETIAWWFSDSHDSIETWQGETRDIPERMLVSRKEVPAMSEFH